MHWRERISTKVAAASEEPRRLSRDFRSDAQSPADFHDFRRFGRQLLLQVDDFLGDAASSAAAAAGIHGGELVDARFQETNRLVLLLPFRAQTLRKRRRRRRRRRKKMYVDDSSFIVGITLEGSTAG